MKTSNKKTLEIIEKPDLMQLPTKPFSIIRLQAIYENNLEKKRKTKKGLVNNNLHKDLVEYVQQYYYEIKKGQYLFYNVINNVFELREKNEFINEVICKCDRELYKDLFEKNNKIYSIVSKINKPKMNNII